MMTPANPRCELCGETITPKQAVEGHVCQRTSKNEVSRWLCDCQAWNQTEGVDVVRAEDYERLTRERDEANRKHAMVTAALKEEAAENDRLRALLAACKNRLVIAASSQYSVEAQLVRQITEALRPADEDKALTTPKPCPHTYVSMENDGLYHCARCAGAFRIVPAGETSTAHWNSDTFPNDQYAQVPIKTAITAQKCYNCGVCGMLLPLGTPCPHHNSL